MSILSLTVVKIGRKIKAEETTVVEVIKAVLEQIRVLEPQAHSYVTVDEEGTLKWVEKVQKQIDDGALIGPPTDVLATIEDNLRTEGLLTTCASRIPEDLIPSHTVETVRNLEKTKAVMPGGTSIGELAVRSAMETSAYGVIENSQNSEHVPGGSLGGSCVAVVTEKCFYTLSPDTGGSTRQSNSYCGVVGTKPTHGTVFRYGLVVYDSSPGQIGPTTKDVTDCITVLEVIPSCDNKDSASVRCDDYQFTSALTDGVKGMRIEIPEDYFIEGLDSDIRDAILAATGTFRKRDVVMEGFDLGLVKYVVPAYCVIAIVGANSNLSRFDGVKYGHRVKGYEELHGMCKKSRSEGSDPEVKRQIMLGFFVLSSGYYDAYYLKALKTEALIKEIFDRAFGNYDVILAPVALTTAPKLGVSLTDPMKMYLTDIYTISVNLAGLPGMTAPCGRDKNGSPIGLQIIEDCFSEKIVIRAGYTLEQIRVYGVPTFTGRDTKGANGAAAIGQAGTEGRQMSRQYEAATDLGVYVELAIRTKAPHDCLTVFDGAPNAHTYPVCTGIPGSLPVSNRQVAEYALAVGLAINYSINQYCKFDRKNYFYPDNPQSYQISQLYLLICYDSWVEVGGTFGKKRVDIHEIHMEEDIGKLTHNRWNDRSLVDYSRSGVPLVEIVPEPDIRSANEAIAYPEKLRLIIQCLGASGCKPRGDPMRADVNLSAQGVDVSESGIRTEMKNLNPFKAVARAIEGERKRQIEFLEEGKQVVRETRRWDDNKGSPCAMRFKEDAHDYRYFPDPDLTLVVTSDEWLDEVRKYQSEFHTGKLLRCEQEFQIPRYDAEVPTGSKPMAGLSGATTTICERPEEVFNWLMVEGMRLLREQEMDSEEIKFSPENLAELTQLVGNGTINRTVAKDMFEEIFTPDIGPKVHVEEKGLKVINGEGTLRKAVEGTVAVNPQPAEDYHNDKRKAMGFLVGQTVRTMDGKTDPVMVNRIPADILDKM